MCWFSDRARRRARAGSGRSIPGTSSGTTSDVGRSGRLHTMRRRAVVATLLLSAILGASRVVAGGDETQATGAAGGLYPPGTVLIGVSPLGLEQDITIEGEGTQGSRSAANIAIYSGTASVDVGDGLPATPGVPFTVTVTTDADGRGTIGLTLGLTTLPSALMNAGSMTVE